jgi:hypothetical protein
MIKGIFDEETYREKVAEIRAEIALHKLGLSELATDRNDFTACLTYGKKFIANIDKFWSGAHPDVKRKVQNIIFPEGISYSQKEGFRTTRMSLIFQYLRVAPTLKMSVGVPMGI